ncbi:MAG: hypothetical protein R3F60_05375 [bacterium]
MRFAGNVNALALSVGPFNITLGEGTFTQANGALDFRGTGFTPGAVLAPGDAGPLFEAFSAITLQATGEVIGHVDGDGFHVEVEADLVAGPFVLEDARLLLDSGFGIRIEGGRFALDFTAFMSALRTLMQGDFDESGAVCRFAGVEIGRLEGSLTDQGFHLAARLRLGVFNEIEFAATVQAFGARVEIDSGFGPGDVSGHVDLRLEGGRLAASFGGEACIEVNYVFGSEDVCIGASGAVDSSGRVCIGFPWPVGTECIDIL